MRYFALASDYDGTLATNGQVDDNTLAALQRLRESGRKLILVTGRHLDDLSQVFPQVDLFDCIVAENGALLYYPATREEQTLGNRPPDAFINALKAKQVEPLGVGRVIVSTWEPHEVVVLQAIRELGLDLQIIFNKGAVMILPAGVNKAVGLQTALTQMGLSAHNVVGVGDAENDRAFLEICEFSVAVANALESVREAADFVTQSARGAGVTELIDDLIATDLSEPSSKIERHNILVGKCADGTPVEIQPYNSSILLAGISGGGKSTLATGILERLSQHGYQFCIFDPEGDYESFEGSVVLGNRDHIPRVEEVLNTLEQPDRNLVINLLGVKLDRRAGFLAEMLPSLLALRARTGRPHWIVLDEAHHMIPVDSNPAKLTLPQSLHGVMMITVHPDHVDSAALRLINTPIAVGKAPEQTISSFCHVVEHCPPSIPEGELAMGEAIVWDMNSDSLPQKFKVQPPSAERRRHMRNYAEGELGSDKWFYFRGREQKLKLKAQNLISFTQLAEGIDDDTWLYHLERQDYSRWLRDAIKDEELAEEVAQIESRGGLSAIESLTQIKGAIEQRYTLPA
ncbi:HAD-IIB family hydrolase [Chamaesiphon polymorphus]|uniref:Phosphoglycolate phosphatase n=1 Tax=Chamaesiphon polymorphus CCALA 037 TaxID=2107692 RepID=A0A2T1F8Z8_9CYAN|nr:HAD-IIB family hydrolase [Chamaesiphon polymorphus]PSB41388.1 phosphoglycolate phosphatase [Chamaesiphon polymorphus CCALA 037]